MPKLPRQAQKLFSVRSGPNKRAQPDEPESSQQASQRRREKQPEPRDQPTEVPQQAPQQQPVLQPYQYQPPPIQPHTGMNQDPPQQSVPVQQPTQAAPSMPQQPPEPPAQAVPGEEEEEDRPKRKGRKRVGKKTEPQPLVGMFNGTQYDSPVSIRQVLMSTKVDMTWMDLAAWSPAVCREPKRLCTRVPKKRLKPPTTRAQPQPQPQPQAQVQP